jgi:endonuclease/exonuclease/phosphatase family metal-dependent hydrolase
MKRSGLIIALALSTLLLMAPPAGALREHQHRPRATPLVSPGAIPVRTLQLNMQALLGGADPQSRKSAVDYVGWIMATGEPIAVSLNEVCPEQVADLRERFSGTYHGAYRRSFVGSRSTDEGCNRDGSTAEYGNAIFMRFAVLDVTRHLYTSTDSGSTRNIICMKTAAFLLTYTACSTHLSVPPPSSQRTEMHYTMLAAASSSTSSFNLGDLNTTRGTLLAIYLDSFKEADLAFCEDPPKYCKRPTGDMGGAVDYIFGSPNTIASPTAWIAPDDLQFTDHRPVVGYYTILY